MGCAPIPPFLGGILTLAVLAAVLVPLIMIGAVIFTAFQ